MKPTMLLVSNSPTTSVGLKSYLNHIFGKYIQIEAFLTENVDTALMEKYDLVLFASKDASTRLKSFLTENIHGITCSRTLNFTYLHKILSIPPNSYVYLVNDSRASALLVIQLLNTFGITQYHFIPWYPAGQEVNYDVQYAVTVGEPRYVPKHISSVVDIGIRVADISTIAEITSFFNLPMSLADVVTNNYINQFVRLLKTSSNQLSQTANREFITQSIIRNIDTGICIVDEKGIVEMVNSRFLKAMDIQQPRLIGTNIIESLPEMEEILKKTMGHQSAHRKISREAKGTLLLTIQEIQDANNKKLLMLHCSGVLTNDNKDNISAIEVESDITFYSFSDYRSANEQVIQMLETAKRISLTDYRLLIQGETGTGKQVLAQAIHNNSRRSLRAFVRLNLSAMSEEQVLEQLEGTDGSEGILKRAEGGTLYLDGIHHLTERLQKDVLRILEEKPDIRFIASTDCNLYGRCLDGLFQKELFYRINEVSLQTIPIRERTEDIPVLFEYFMRNIYNNSTLSASELCTEGLWRKLKEYPWPGNGKEIENLCKYFYCVRSERKLNVSDLPPYMREQMAEKEGRLEPIERQVLQLVKQYPKIGRKRLNQIMEQQGVTITESNVRSILGSLADRDLIRMNRTRGGCEITEQGQLLL